MPQQESSNTSGTMPSFFASSANLRSQSLPEPPQHAITGPYVRRGSTTLEALARGMRKKSELEIVLDGKDEFVRTYSTFDQIKGHIQLKFEKDTLISDLSIVFEGQAQTYVEKVATASPTIGRTTGRHTFLRVQQPISPESLPEDMLGKANTAYIVPFTFIVPDRLLPYICSHKTANDEVKKAHLRLPPSIGDPMLSGVGNALMDDLSPEMARICYSIKAKVGKASPATGRTIHSEEKIARIRIVSAREEEPPLSIDEQSTSYVLRKEKNVRKGVFKIGKKLGRLTAEVTQPRSLNLPVPASATKSSVTTMAAVTLRFDPATLQEQPPQMANLVAKLKVNTFFGAAAYTVIPEVAKFNNWSTMHGLYPETVALSCRNIGSVAWTKHNPEDSKRTGGNGLDELQRRDSNFSTVSSTSSSSLASIPGASSSYDSSLPFYTAKVLVPVSLPHTSVSDEEGLGTSIKSPVGLNRNSKRIIFTPTFHSCLVSRSYTLELGLSFHPASSAGSSSNALTQSSMTLRTPIQISQEGAIAPPAEMENPLLDLSLVEGTDEYDEAMARHLDQQLNFSNPFLRASDNGRPEAIPEYEEVQTTAAYSDQASRQAQRHSSIAVPPSSQTTTEQPPEYYSPFRTPGAGVIGGRRVSIRS
ncbi:hypothetical protein PMZ80_002802 [Knufia obscura]|uniref:Arrestin-like N-terminal domain-containing protein n=2 Tax=Knufia TaxID=430999 RepID=A0AAN8E8V1_9EURO|nr:hypothetical protein PMZ80_002802 [Knufia obscura]KAK5948393.1 hypothetical protein OHC33_010567 [Knufia fluminis]